MNGRDLTKWKPPVIDAHVHEDGGKDSSHEAKSNGTKGLFVLVSIVGALLAVTIISAASESRSEKVSEGRGRVPLFFKASPAKLVMGPERFGVLIPGEIDDTFLYAEWDREDDSFWLEIRDERPGTVWHIDGESNAVPSIDAIVSTASQTTSRRFRRTEQHESPYLYREVDDFFVSLFKQAYIDVQICSTKEHLQFNTDQHAVRTAVSRYFAPAVQVKKTLAEKEEAKRIAEKEEAERLWQQTREERITEAFVGDWNWKEKRLYLKNDGSCRVLFFDKKRGINCKWNLDFSRNTITIRQPGTILRYTLKVNKLADLTEDDLPELDEVRISGNLYGADVSLSKDH